MSYVYTTLTNLNIFLIRDFGSNIDRRKAKRLGQWATRLYLVSFAVGLVILTLHTIIRPQEFTKDFDGPPLDLYTKLFKRYGTQLKCPCSSIASTYNQFMNIEARFHEICSSPFASTQGRLNLTVDVVANLSMYNERDYRRFLSAHLQFLEGLCQLSHKTVNIFTRQFLSSLFVTNELLSEMNFEQRLNLTIDQSKLNVPTTLTHLLYLIRMINNGNAFISTYGTNFEYIHPWEDIYNTYTPTQAMIYDNNCSCGLYSNCTTQANFILTNPTKIIPIKGLKIGCTPSESFRASTLECFYNESCINLIKQYTIKANRINNTSVFEPLSTQNISFSINTPIAKLIDNLFITDWNITMNYTSYFEQCFPLSCSYNNIQRFNVFHIIATLLGLQGGLALVLEWICPKIIRIIVKIYEYRKKRRNVVQPVFTVETMPIENIDNSVSILELTPMNETFQRNSTSNFQCSFKFAAICMLLLFIVEGLVLFSINIVRPENNQVSSTAEFGCSLKYQRVSSAIGTFQSRINQPVIADFNGDNLLDIAFGSYDINGMSVLVGSGNGSFKSHMISIRNTLPAISKMIVGDFDNDNHLDLAVQSKWFGTIHILLAYGDGTFRMHFNKRFCTLNSLDFALIHVDNDTYLDMVVVCSVVNAIGVYFGNGRGEYFIHPLTLFANDNSYPLRVAVADFNCDNFEDIAVLNHYGQNIGIFINDGARNFKAQITSFTRKEKFPSYFAIGDFNNDTLPDVAVSYNCSNFIDVIFGFGNGSLGNSTMFQIGEEPVVDQIIVDDFNGDGNLDIGFGKTGQTINLLIGDGHRNFTLRTAFPISFSGAFAWTGVGDFNGDGFVDIINVDLNSTSQDVFLNVCK
ncbi:unnamed protein product [Adineta steineri]|uniref:Uncharacterized protein n=2 Tax=Adineta steineri TaxID=433720 RepID=A0A815FMG2_9BILA|nr:unnamed protein product [Adineta steineri]